MGLDLIPAALHAKYRLAEFDHACAILARDFPNEFEDIMDCLTAFTLKKSAVLTPGGGRSPIPVEIDGFLSARGWSERSFSIEITVDGTAIPVPTIESITSRIASASKWNGTIRPSSTIAI